VVCRDREQDDPDYLLSKLDNGGMTPDEICQGCRLFRTKPGKEPPQITQAITFANEHEEAVDSGYRFKSLNRLTPLQWASIRGLTRGRKQYEEFQEEKRRTNDGNSRSDPS
jgi:hypothetical protein